MSSTSTPAVTSSPLTQDIGSADATVNINGEAIGFFGVTAAAQPATIADATDAASAITQLNLVIAALETLGLVASA